MKWIKKKKNSKEINILSIEEKEKNKNDQIIEFIKRLGIDIDKANKDDVDKLFFDLKEKFTRM